MPIFKQIDELLSGRKTETRRLVKPGEILETFVENGVEVSRVMTAKGREKYRTGKPYPIIPRMFQPALKSHKVVFHAIRQELLHAIDETGATNEGVANVDAYRDLWGAINGPRSWDKNPPVFVYRFVVLSIEELNPVLAAFRVGFEQAMRGETMPIATLWDDFDEQPAPCGE